MKMKCGFTLNIGDPCTVIKGFYGEYFECPGYKKCPIHTKNTKK